MSTMNETSDQAAQDLGRLTQLLDDVEAAMERIDQGTYGRCEACAKELDRHALTATPTLQYCTSCSQTRNDG